MSKKKKIIIILLVIILFVMILTLFINIHMVSSTQNQIIEVNDLDNAIDIDAVVVLGCLAYEDGPSLMLKNRLDKGIEVYNKINTKIILTGDHGRNEYDEVNTMNNYVKESDIPEEDIFLDHAGFNTYDSIYRAKYIFEAKKIIIVTQKFHMYRALYIANNLGIEAKGILADDIPQKGIMLKNEIREIFSRDKNFFKVLFKPKSKYLGEKIPLTSNGIITNG